MTERVRQLEASPDPRRPAAWVVVLVGLGLALLGCGTALAQSPGVTTVLPLPMPVSFQDAQNQPEPPPSPADVVTRQVTLFGVLASPNSSETDPKLATVAPQLRKLLPNHGFRLLGVQTRRLTPGQTLICPLTDGFSAEATLLHPFDGNGKVQLRCGLKLGLISQLETLVGTPPNQLFFCEKPFPNGQRLLIGIGAR